MASSLLGQIKELEEKIKAALAVAKSLQSERDHLAREVSRVRQELEAARGEASSAKSELAALAARVEGVSREKLELERERGEVLERVEHLLQSLSELEAAAVATS